MRIVDKARLKRILDMSAFIDVSIEKKDPVEALAAISAVYMTRMINASPELRAHIHSYAKAVFSCIGNEIFEDQDDAIEYLNENFINLNNLEFKEFI
jgi:hypothetical protein